MARKTYRMPEPTGQVADLVPESADGSRLTPETAVLAINRGRVTLKDKFDGRDYLIPPGEVMMPYGAARHFQRRLVIPGTRNPEAGTQQSFIGIKGLDDPPLCVPLTDEECVRFGEAVEALDRSGLTSQSDREVEVIKAPGGGGVMRTGGMRPKIDTSQQASPAAREAAEHVFDPPTESATKADAAAARASGHESAGGEDAGGGSRRRRQ